MENELVVFKNFTGKDILEDAIKFYKEESGEDLEICSKEYYTLSATAYSLEVLATNMEEEAKQNFLRYARGIKLDFKGEFHGKRGERLKENTARTTMECTTSILVPTDILIPKATRFIHKNYIFYTEKDYFIKKGTNKLNLVVVSETPGYLGGIKAGEIKEIVDKYDFFGSCINITDVTGGTDRESDEKYRKRIQLLPESYSCAGSAPAYKFHTLKASNLVTDAVVETPTPNYIDIYILNGKKLVSEEEKEKILSYLSQKHIKAMNDQISIKDPTIREFELNIDYWLYSDSKTTKFNVEERLEELLKEHTDKYKLGSSINTQDFIEIAKSLKEVKRVKINISDEPGAKTNIFVCKKTSLIYKGSEER